MSQTIDRDEGVGFLSSLGVLCLAADGRWAVNRSDSNGPDSPFKARGRPGLASHWPPQPRPVVLCAGRSAPAWLAFAGSARRQTDGGAMKNRASSDRAIGGRRLLRRGGAFCRVRIVPLMSRRRAHSNSLNGALGGI